MQNVSLLLQLNNLGLLLEVKLAAEKTTVIKELIENLKRKNVSIGEIYTQKIFENEVRIGFDVVPA
jgi:nucleoside-triphosphatase THEP1